MTHPQQIQRKPLPIPLSTNPKPPRTRTMPNPVTAYEPRSWIDTIPTPCLKTHPIYSDMNCRLVMQQIVCDEAGEPSRFILRVVIQPGCEEMMLRAMLDECPAATAAACVVPVARDGGGVMSAEGIRIALKKSVES